MKQCLSVNNVIKHFGKKRKLEEHNEKVHKKVIKNLVCSRCEEIFDNQYELKGHIRQCTSNIKSDSEERICYFFQNGRCRKGDACRFRHSEAVKSRPCRYGVNCRFFDRGVCKFDHSMDKERFNNSRWCRYQEDCFRVPNCQFLHAYEQDFPKLPTHNGPPIPQRKDQNMRQRI